MGNKNDTVHEQKQQRSKRNTNNKSNKPSPDGQSNNFIFKAMEKNTKNGKDVIETTLDQRRIVFVSLIGLYLCWKSVPAASLYNSLLLIPFKKVWVYEPIKYKNELKQSFLDIVAKFGDKTDLNAANIRDFLQFLKWKHSQGLVIWIVDHFGGSDHKFAFPKHSSMISPFWHCVSDKLCSLYNNISASNYAPLRFEEKWWKNKAKFVSKYDTKYAQISSEYQFVTMNYKAMCEILYQSNPKSLRPVIVYRNRSNTKCLLTANNKKAITNSKSMNNRSVMSPLSPIKEVFNI